MALSKEPPWNPNPDHVDAPHPSSSVHFLDPAPKPSLESIKSEPPGPAPEKSRLQHDTLARSPSLPHRHPRVQSEIVKPHRRTSIVTGGYQSSDSDTSPSTQSHRQLYPQSRKPFETPRKMSSRRAPARMREITSSPDSRKGKERANGLAASLGLDSAKEGLTSDQINDLLNDTDVVSALRMMNNSNLAARLTASRQEPVQSPQAPKQSEPFIARAPPPLMQDSETRDRNVSNASSTAPPPHQEWHAAVARRASRSEGGHIPFTHPIAEEETRDRTVSNASTIGPPPNQEWHAAVQRRVSRSEGGHIPFTHPIAIEEEAVTEEDHSVEGASTPSRAKKAKHHRLSNLFHLKKRNVSQVMDESEVHSSASRSEREDREHEKEQEMRRVEAQRREEELLQERRFKALTQVAAHPDSERLAYRASSHLRNYYNLVFEGLDDPPRLNPLAILRWKHKTEEQAELQGRWENRSVNQTKITTGWHYTTDDVVAYRSAKGVVNYFVPPRATFQPTSPHRDSGESSRKPESSSSRRPSTTQGLESKISLGSGLTSGEKASVLSFEAAQLSRSNSTDRRRRQEVRSPPHRHHQSLGAIAPERLAHAIRNPFERINKLRGDSKDEDSSVEGRRRAVTKSGSLTDDEHQFHLRNLIPRAFDARKSPDLSNVQKERQAELQALTSALAKETALRERQNETERKSRLEKEAQERLNQLQNEIYAEKQLRLVDARRRVELLDLSVEDTEDTIRQYIVLSDQISDIAQVSFGIKASFPELPQLKTTYVKANTPAMHAVSTMGHGRRSSMQSIFAYGINPFPRRLGGDRAKPVQRVEQALVAARDAQLAMHAERRDTETQLRGMITRIDALMKQKDAVRAWTKSALESNRILRLNMESLNAEVVGNNRARMLRWRDRMIDFGLRQGVGQLFKLVYRLWYVVIWSASWRTRTARQNLRDDQKGWRGVPWGTSMFIVGLGAILLFYHLGG